ncbi:MAG: 50S ribosomal protein L35 [Vampirovibrionia bacterium]
MPKMKTHRAAAKRYKVTASGKIKRRHAFKKHILTKKQAERKRRLGHMEELFEGEVKRVKVQLPYLKYSR